MAHFFWPPDAPKGDYDVDGKLAPDSVSRMRIPPGERRTIGLWGGQGFFIKSNNPLAVPNGIFIREPQKDISILTLQGGSPGMSVIEAGPGNQVWVTLQVDVKTGIALIDDFTLARPYQPDFLTMAAANFALGFAEGVGVGLANRPALARIARDKVMAKPLNFYRGYTTGVFIGLIGGLKSLLSLIADVAKLANAVSPPKLVETIIKEGYLVLTSEARRDFYRMQVRQAKQMAAKLLAIIREIQARPMAYIAKSQYAGALIGREVAGAIATRIETASAEELGKDVGTLVGRVMFEIIVAVVLAACTGGAGEAARGATLVAEAGEEGAEMARLVKTLGEGLEEAPALRRLANAAAEGEELARVKPPIPRGLISKGARPPDFKPPNPSELKVMEGIHEPPANAGVSARAHPRPSAGGNYASGALDDPTAGKEVFKPSGALRTGIDATNAEFDAFNELVHTTGEIGIQSPGHANAAGIDFITANRNAAGEMEIFVNDATINRAKDVKTSLPPSWRTELDAAIRRLELGAANGDIQAEIVEASKIPSRIKLRTFFVERTPQGTIRMTKL